MTPTHRTQRVQALAGCVRVRAGGRAGGRVGEPASEWQRTPACHSRMRHAAKHNSKA